jgi:transcriptional regulator with XRE-family HTH domain
MPERGWDAKGMLQPLWGRVGGRDGLAAATGIQPSTLSGINSGRLRLGYKNGRRIAEALDVSLLDLGAPLDQADDRASLSLRRNLQLLAEANDAYRATLAKLTQRIDALEHGREARGRGRGRR